MAVRVAQPALSRQLKKLEHDLGVGLLLRTAKGVSLTHAGQLLLERSLEIERFIENTNHEIADLADNLSGTIRLALQYPISVAACSGTRRVADLLANPTHEMLEKSFDYGRYLTFQRPLGPVMRHVSAMTENMPVLKLVVPFVRTPANLLKFSIERSSAVPLLMEWRAEVKAGDARRDLALARSAVRSGMKYPEGFSADMKSELFNPFEAGA